MDLAEVLLQLVKSKCTPVLLHGLEALSHCTKSVTITGLSFIHSFGLNNKVQDIKVCDK